MKHSILPSIPHPVTLILAILWGSFHLALAQNPGVDPSFSSDGKYFFSLGTSAEQFEDMAIDGAGRMIFAGDTDNDPDEGGNRRGIVVRLLADGTPDISFGDNGVVIIDFPASNDNLNAVAVDNNNNIIVCGRTNVYDAALFKLNATNGALDNGFGIGGRVALVEGYDFNDMAVLPNQQIIAAGWGIVVANQDANYLAARFNPNGSLDTGFGTNNGFTHVDIEDEDYANSLAIEADGDIVLAGYSITCSTGNCHDLSLVKLKANGQIDTGFGPSGIGKILYKTAPQTGEARFYNVLLQNIQGEEKILLSGYHEPGSNEEYAGFVMRLRNNGNFESFGGSSAGFVNLPTIPYAVMALQSDHKILLTSYAIVINGSNIFATSRIMRRNADGTPDNTFGSNGTYDVQVGTYLDAPGAIRAEGNKLYILGTLLPSSSSSTDQDAFVARLINCGSGPVFTETSTPATCGLANGTATVNVTGGGANTFLWSNGQTTNTVTNLAGGNYTVTVTSEEGCSSTSSVAVTALQVANINVTKTDAKCGLNNGSATVSLVSGPAVAYNWSNNASTSTIFNLAPGSYTVTATDANGCMIVKSVQVNDTPLPVIGINTIHTTCGNNNGSAEVVLQIGPAITSYIWSNGQTTKKIQNLPPAMYAVTITDVNGCTLTTSTTVNNSALFNIDLGPDITIQQGQAATLDATTPGAVSYLWSTGQTSATIVVNMSGAYFVTATDSEGCTASDAITMNLITAANDPTQTFRILVYPNPAEDILNIQSDDVQLTNVMVLDIAGRLVKQVHFSTPTGSSVSVDINDLPPGAYTISMKGKSFAKSVLITKK